MPLKAVLALVLGALVCASAMARPAPWGRNKLPALLPADEAFQLLPVERRGPVLHIEWNVAPGYYLYRGRLGFELLAPRGASLGTPSLPTGEAYHDEFFGDVEIYRGILPVELAVTGSGKRPLRLRLHFQGCADVGVCYPPQTREIEVQGSR